MNRMFTSGLLSALLTFPLAGLVRAGDKDDNSPKTLEVTKATRKVEVRDSQIGFRDTLLFYTFTAQRAVLKLQIDNKVDNKDKSFPMTGTIYIFGEGVKEDDLEKWINNQHSDGLFPDVPEPVAIRKLPKNTGKVNSSKLIERSKQTFGEYDDYAVMFDVRDYSDNQGIALKGFSDVSKVYVKTK